MAQIKVLVVEDSPTQLLKTRLPLLNAGYEVVTAVNGEEGFKAAEAQHPNVILLDMVMPVLDGKGMLAKLKETADLREIPVIMLTATSEPETIMNVMSMGAKDYIVKPFDMEVFEQKVKKIIRHLNVNASPAERITADIDRKVIRYDEHEGIHIFEVKPETLKIGLKMVFSYIRRLLAVGEHRFVLDFSAYTELPEDELDLLASCLSSMQKGAGGVRFIATNAKILRQFQTRPETSEVRLFESRKEVLLAGF